MKYFIIAGEQSGDLHGSNLVRELRASDTQAEIFCWGGDLMESAGAKLLKHYRDTAFMGFTVILKNLGKISSNLALCKSQITEYKPDVIILIDYPGFNLRIARFGRETGFRVFYYISPKFWAWNESRVKKVKKYVDRMFIIFPFETGFYSKHGIEVRYRGNPLVDEIEKQKAQLPSKEAARKQLQADDRPVIALLAGSRRHEVEKILPHMLNVIKHFPDHQFILAGVKNIPDEFYKKVMGSRQVRLVRERAYEVLSIADAAIVKSGTSTLETALLGVPQVVVYRGDFVSMLIAWMVIRVKYISLVNLIMDSEIVRELLQYKVNEKNLKRELEAILPGGNKRDKIIAGYRALEEKLGPSGASARVATEMVKELKRE